MLVLENVPSATSVSQLYLDLAKNTPYHSRVGRWKHRTCGRTSRSSYFSASALSHFSLSCLSCSSGDSHLFFFIISRQKKTWKRPVDGHIDITPAFHRSFYTWWFYLCFYRSDPIQEEGSLLCCSSWSYFHFPPKKSVFWKLFLCLNPESRRCCILPSEQILLLVK